VNRRDCAAERTQQGQGQCVEVVAGVEKESGAGAAGYYTWCWSGKFRYVIVVETVLVITFMHMAHQTLSQIACQCADTLDQQDEQKTFDGLVHGGSWLKVVKVFFFTILIPRIDAAVECAVVIQIVGTTVNWELQRFWLIYHAAQR
jgi:hypothetical protein